jgi:hypothetical protein
MDFYAKILDEYNFLIKDELIEYYKMSTQADFEEFVKLKNIDMCENHSFKSIFKEKAEIVIFLLTNNYFNSKRFDHDLNEVIEMKKDILMVLLEKEINPKRMQFKDRKVFSLINYFEGKWVPRYSFPEKLDSMSFMSSIDEFMEYLNQKLNIIKDVGNFPYRSRIVILMFFHCVPFYLLFKSSHYTLIFF